MEASHFPIRERSDPHRRQVVSRRADDYAGRADGAEVVRDVAALPARREVEQRHAVGAARYGQKQRTELGDLAFPVAFELAKRIKQATGEKRERTEWHSVVVFGGGAGSKPVVFVERPGQERLELLKVNGVKVPKGTVIRTRTGGGGGYGKASERDPAAVREDLIDGYVTAEHALTAYRVAFDDAGNVDVAMTERLRSA